MAIIINKPTLPEEATSEQQATYNTSLNLYNFYLDTIRTTVWRDLTAADIPEGLIDNPVMLQAAEREIISKYGSDIADNTAFKQLSDTDQSKLIEGTILQTALYLLPTVPQLKRQDINESEYEFFQVADRDKEIQARIGVLFPDAAPIDPDDPVPNTACIVTYDITY